jgi:rare lipoprotein A
MLKDTILHGRFSSGQILKTVLIRGGLSGAKLLMFFVLLVSLTACGLTARSGKSYVVNGKRYYILASANGFKEKGTASWYGEPFHGRKTASGEVYDMNKVSAAHKTLPLHTWVEVRNLENNQVVTLRINDRGPFVNGRIIDLSKAAAERMGVLGPGTAKVAIKAITGDKARRLTEEEQRREAALQTQAAMVVLQAVQPKTQAAQTAAQAAIKAAAVKSAAAKPAPAKPKKTADTAAPVKPKKAAATTDPAKPKKSADTAAPAKTKKSAARKAPVIAPAAGDDDSLLPDDSAAQIVIQAVRPRAEAAKAAPQAAFKRTIKTTAIKVPTPKAAPPAKGKESIDRVIPLTAPAALDDSAARIVIQAVRPRAKGAKAANQDALKAAIRTTTLKTGPAKVKESAQTAPAPAPTPAEAPAAATGDGTAESTRITAPAAGDDGSAPAAVKK